jgi:hypothetical protein
VLLAVGSVTMVGALVTPAGADPGNGHAYGHYRDDRTPVLIEDPAPDQPAADQQATDPGNGANQNCGAYCPSGVGLPSGNGNGDGNATGKPCAGCVGNADDKNPPGQYKDGSDHNNGYECDGNNGIGKTNPAHSGCQATPTTVPKTTTTTSAPCTGPSCSTTTTVPKTTTTTSAPCTGASCPTTTVPCSGDNCTTTTTSGATVLGESFVRPNDPGSQASTGPLAFTGGVVGKLFFAGLALALMGIVIMAHRARGALADRD